MGAPLAPFAPQAPRCGAFSLPNIVSHARVTSGMYQFPQRGRVLDKVKLTRYIDGMAATPESKVKDKIKAVFKQHGIYYAMPIGTGYGNSGVPDFLACVQGHFLAVEAKAGKGKTTALQDKHISQIKAQGGTALIINEENIDELKTLLEQLSWTLEQKSETQ